MGGTYGIVEEDLDSTAAEIYEGLRDLLRTHGFAPITNDEHDITLNRINTVWGSIATNTAQATAVEADKSHYHRQSIVVQTRLSLDADPRYRHIIFNVTSPLGVDRLEVDKVRFYVEEFFREQGML